MKKLESHVCHSCIFAVFDGNAKDTCALDNDVRNHDNINNQTFNSSCPLKAAGGKIEVFAVEFMDGE